MDRVSVPSPQTDSIRNEAVVLTEYWEFIPETNIETQASGDFLSGGRYPKIVHDDLSDGVLEKEQPIRLTTESSRSLSDVTNNPGHLVDHWGLVVRVWGGDTKPMTVLSAMSHLLLIFMLVVAPTYDTGSDQGQNNLGVIVRLIEWDEVTPVEESPGSRDAPASRAALAKRSPFTEEKHPTAEDVPSRDLLEQSPIGLKEVRETGCVGEEDAQLSRDLSMKKEDDPTPSQLEKTDSRFMATSDTVKDSLFVENSVSYDSVESAPSSASPERRTDSLAASVGNEYRNKILSAINEAAYYPKKALQERINGETVVSFTIQKNGALLNVSVCKPSGYEILDNAAITIVRRASHKFPSIPDEVMSESLSYEVPIIFKKRS